MQRTVWNWQNLGKSTASVLFVAVVWQLLCWAFEPHPAIAAVLGAVIGMLTMMAALARWPGWRFEWTED
jgi:membrane protein YdbS with pleckstrin-like domain